MANHDVISAVIDNEPFDPAALSEALADPGGRELLLDLLALRKLTLMDDAKEPAAMRPPVSPVRRAMYLAAAAAVLVLAIAGGYELGERSAHASAAPPAPTVVIKGDAWQDVPNGGAR